MAARLAKVSLLALLALAVTASSGSAARPAHAPMLGVVPHAGAPQLFGALNSVAPAANPSGPLSLQTQPCNMANFCWVMRTNTVYAIYWMPSGSTCGGNSSNCPAYETGVDKYFTDVAHDSGQATNAYSAATQYYDATGPISYASTFADSYVDTNPYPANGCDDSVNGPGTGDPVCLTDQQLEDEIQNVLTAKGWHGSTTTMFFILTPDKVGSCFLPGNAGDPNQACTTDTYCAYHSGFVDSNNEPVIYGNEPFNAGINGCNGEPGQGSPNDPNIDPSLNTLSHEHNEAITDPWGDAWTNGSPAGENGDLCDFDFGPKISTVNGQDYNQVINGDKYSLQQEYSNDGLGCVQHYLGVPVNFGAPTIAGAAGQGRVLTAGHGLWSQSPTSYAYVWQRCTSAGTGCANIPNAVSGTYTLGPADTGSTVRVEVSAQNTAGTSALVSSAVTSVVVPTPNATVAPVVSGTAAVNKQLTTTNGTWNTAASFAYAWLRCDATSVNCAVIPGATSATYSVASADAGHTLEARVTATNAAGTTAAVSNASGVVVDVPSASATPHVSGRAKVGKKLTASKGSWSQAPTSYRFQWLRCNGKGGSCTAIGKATHAAYKLTKKDAKHRLRVRVTAVNAAGSGVAISGATATVKP